MATTKTLIPGVPNEVTIIGGLGLVAVGVYLVIQHNKKSELKQADSEAQAETAAALPAASTTTPKPVTQTATINKDLMLKVGSKGAEVTQLQKLLGITADGIFGAQTEASLYKRKMLKQITLNQYDTSPDVNQNPLVKGTSVMAYKQPSIKIYATQELANGSFTFLTAVDKEVSFGKEVGKIVGFSALKDKYLVLVSGVLTNYVGWVKASEVKKI